MKHNRKFQLLSLTLAITLLTGCGGGSNTTITPPTPTPEPEPMPNVAPTVAVTAQTIARSNQMVALEGTANDSDGSISSYQWQQTAGPEVTLVDADKASASFVAPETVQVEMLTFSFTATDDDGDSASDDLNINIIPADSVKINQLSFNDNNLQQCVVDTATAQGAIIARQITSLNCAGKQIADLSDITQLMYVNDLDLSNNAFTSLIPLYSLTQLTSLKLQGLDQLYCVAFSALEKRLSTTAVTGSETCITSERQQWVMATADGIASSPAIDSDGTIYVGSNDGNLYAVNPDGSMKWSYSAGATISTAAAIGMDNSIYFAASNKKLYALNPDGSMKWMTEMSGNGVTTAAISADGTIYMATDDHKMQAVKPDGSMYWSIGAAGAILGSATIAKDNTVYFGAADGKLYAVNPDGTMGWFVVTQGAIYASPIIGNDGTLYFGNSAKKFYALNSKGEMQWSAETSGEIHNSAAIDVEGNVYVGSNDGKLYALQDDGIVKWVFNTDDKFSTSPAISHDGTIFIGNNDSMVYAVNSNGSQKWTFKTLAAITSSPAIASDGSVYIASHDQHLYSINGDSGQLAQSAWPKAGQNNLNAGHSLNMQSHTARYKAVFTTYWSAETFPTNVPAQPHYSTIFGNTHVAEGRIWQAGQLASPGIKGMAERGFRDILSGEINALIAAGHAEHLFIGVPVLYNETEVSFEIDISADFPLLSLVTMVAPSPDWFLGLESQPMRTDGKWLYQYNQNLKVWDAGTDDGLAFSSADKESDPYVPIALLTSDPNHTDLREGVHRDDPDLTLASVTLIRID